MNRDKQQLARNKAWIAEYGELENPVQLDTYRKADQVERIFTLSNLVEGRILEVGCNWGYVLAQVQGHVGVDINPLNVYMARQLARERTFYTADARALPFEDNAFDTVMLTEILEHLPWEDVSTAVGEARRVAKKKVVISIPDGDKDTDEATNAKHKWLCTSERIAVLRTFLGYNSDLTRRGPFAYIVGRFT